MPITDLGSAELDARLTVETLIDDEIAEIQQSIALEMSLAWLHKDIAHRKRDSVLYARRYNRQIVYMQRIKRLAIGAELCPA